MIGIAAAPDFTDDLIWNQLTTEQQAEMKRDGRIALPNPYAPEDVIYTLKLIEDGRDHGCRIAGQTGLPGAVAAWRQGQGSPC